MKKFLLLFALFPVLCVSAGAADALPPVSAGAMILLHADSGRVLAERNADSRRLIASTTKLMTALVAAESLPVDAVTVIRPEWTGVEGSSLYLKSGETFTVRELLEGLLLSSGNDAALALAGTADGSVDGFVERMNRRASELGMGNTHFSNPHGLDAEDHYSTARDLAVLMNAALKNSVLRDVMSEREAIVRGRYCVNHNKLLGKCPGVDGGKTGYTKTAGRCLVSTCCRDGLRLICVTLSDPLDWDDHRALYDWAYDRYEAWSLAGAPPPPEVSVLLGAERRAVPVPEEDGFLCLEKGETVTIRWKLPPFLVALPPAAGLAGEAEILVNGSTWKRIPLVWECRAES